MTFLDERYFRYTIVRVYLCRPVKASGQAVAGDHAAELANAGKIARIDEACERQEEWKERGRMGRILDN